MLTQACRCCKCNTSRNSVIKLHLRHTKLKKCSLSNTFSKIDVLLDMNEREVGFLNRKLILRNIIVKQIFDLYTVT